MRLPSVNRLRAGVRALRRPLLAAGIAAALLFAGWLGAGEWYRSIEARAVRAEGREMLAWVEARVRGAIGEGHARLVALESFIHPAASEHVERAEFQTFARCLTEGREEFRRITVVPAEGEEFVYPPFVAPMEDEVAGGEARAEPFGSLGTRDRPGAAPAEETGRVVMSGPYAADGGPPVLFLRKAVYHDGAYWGVMSLVLDVKQLMQDAGVRPVTDGFCVRIRRAEASEPFFGCGGTFEDDPVRREFDIFGERWELEAVPAGGMAEAIGGPLALFRWLTLIPVVLIPVLVFNVAARGRILQRRLERRTRSLSEQLHERTRAEQRLEAERALLERISATSPVGIVVLDAAGRITFANPHARRLLGIESLSDEDLRYDAPRWGAADLDGNPVREEDYPFRRVMATGRPAYDMRLLLYIGGATRVISVNAAPISRSGKEEPEPPTAVVMTVDDISEQVRAERRARKLNRLYAVLSSINQSIIRVRDAETLFRNVARVAVAEGEFAGVWVAIADGQKRLRVIAGDGVHLDGEEEGERIVVSREAYRDHPARTALTTGSYAIVNNVYGDLDVDFDVGVGVGAEGERGPPFGAEAEPPWRRSLIERGVRSAASFCFPGPRGMRGCITLYAEPSRFFDREEIELLKELADDVGFALEYLERDAQVRQALREKDVLLREVHHRVKNNLNIITSLLSLQQSSISDAADAEAAFERTRYRVHALAQVHQMLYESDSLERIDFAQYIADAARQLQYSYGVSEEVRVTLELEQVDLDMDRAIPAGLIFTELFTNALKHGAPEDGDGEVRVVLETERDKDRQTVLSVSDSGGSFDSEGTGAGASDREGAGPSLGLELVRALTEQLRGTLDVRTDRGTTFEVRFPG